MGDFSVELRRMLEGIVNDRFDFVCRQSVEDCDEVGWAASVRGDLIESLRTEFDGDDVGFDGDEIVPFFVNLRSAH